MGVTRHDWFRGAGFGLLLIQVGCVTIPGPDHPRPALPLPAEIAERYALPGEVHEDYLVPLDSAGRIFRGRLRCGDERPEFHLMLPASQRPAPFVVCLPILAGGKELMWWVAEYLADAGFAVTFSERVESAMKPHQDAEALERLFRRSLVHNRAILAWGRRQAFTAPGQTGVLGISTGGIMAGTILALEPELRGGVLILAGGDLPDLLMQSSESRIQRWRAARQAVEGLDEAQLLAKLRKKLHSDPALTAPYVATDKVLMVSASWDTVVPARNQEVLWEALGRPKRFKLLLLSHYSSILDIVLPTQTILRSSANFLLERLAGAHPAPRQRQGH